MENQLESTMPGTGVRGKGFWYLAFFLFCYKYNPKVILSIPVLEFYRSVQTWYK